MVKRGSEYLSESQIPSRCYFSYASKLALLSVQSQPSRPHIDIALTTRPAELGVPITPTPFLVIMRGLTFISPLRGAPLPRPDLH